MPIGRVEAQSNWWSIPETIPLYDPETWPPILIADQNRTVHAFSSQWIDDGSNGSIRAIVYNQWSFEQGWTNPIDIILSPNKEARLTDAYLDNNGVFHVVFFGGDNTSANIYYSQAPAVIADKVSAWSVPIIIGRNAKDPEMAVIVENDQGTLFVIYASRESGGGLFVVDSMDDGATWSDSRPMFLPERDEQYLSELKVINSKSVQFHAIWAVNNDVGQGRGIFYTSSQDGSDWHEPVLLEDAKDGLGTQDPTIFEYKGTLFVLYITQIGGANKMVMQQSRDGGVTWDNPSMIFPHHEGVNGLLSLVTDANNDLHLFFGQRIPGDPDIHGMWHSLYLNNRWGKPEGIIRGIKILDREGFDSFDPNAARAVVSQGNVILVTWRTDPGSKGNGVWFSYRKIDAPELPIFYFPTPFVDVATPTLDTLEKEVVIQTPQLPTPIMDITLNDYPSRQEYVGRNFVGVIIIVLSVIVFFFSVVRKRS